MYIEELLEVAIGLVFMWLVLALACMGVQEWLAGLLKFRSRDLEKAIRRMLQEPSESASVLDRLKAWFGALFGGTSNNLSAQGQSEVDNGLATKLYDHPLIKALSKPGGRPSYIPDRTFALALFDVVMTAGTDASTIKGVLETLHKKEGELPQLADQAVKVALTDLITMAGEAANDETKLPGLKKELNSFTTNYPQLKPVLDALLQVSLDKDATKMLENVAGSAARLAVSNPQVAQSINSLITGVEAYVKEGEKALAVARTNVETWFNDTNARLTGTYKRRAQVIGITFGVIFAIVLNVDTVTIATTLWREPTIRQALVAQAENFKFPDETEGVDPATAIEEFSERFDGLYLPIGWKQIELQELEEGEEKRLCTLNPIADTKQYVWGIPTSALCIAPVDVPEDKSPRQWIGGKILGWAISGAAASMGAPFWFDVLKKLTNVRSSGKNPAEEKPKK
jgi:hypothetical protein